MTLFPIEKAPSEGAQNYGYPPIPLVRGGRVWIALRISATAGRIFSAEPVKCLATASASAPTPFPHGLGNHHYVR